MPFLNIHTDGNTLGFFMNRYQSDLAKPMPTNTKYLLYNTRVRLHYRQKDFLTRNEINTLYSGKTLSLFSILQKIVQNINKHFFF